jgi:hypothetical protein
MQPVWLQRVGDLAYRRLGLEARFGSGRAWMNHRRTLRSLPSVEEGLARIAEFSLPSAEDTPVFLLSAGWRAGSTLLQRLIVSGGEIFLWGEPYDRCDYVRRLADSMRAFSGRWPRDGSFYNGGPAEGWIANLYPSPSDLLEAHRAFFRRLFWAPLEGTGYKRWGFKEVRLGTPYALYLKTLFPRSQFVIIYRNPFDSYASYRNFRGWYDRWPSQPVFGPKQFGRMWRDLVSGLLESSTDLGALVVRYEDLVSDPAWVTRISNFLETPVREGVLQVKEDGRSSDSQVEDLPAGHKRVLAREVGNLAEKLGYRTPAIRQGK